MKIKRVKTTCIFSIFWTLVVISASIIGILAYVRLNESKVEINKAQPVKQEKTSESSKTVAQKRQILKAKKTTTSIPSSGPLKSQVSRILGSQRVNYGIFIKNLNTGETVVINENNKFCPASIYKVIVAVMTLQDIKNGKYSPETALTLKKSHQRYSTDFMSRYSVGSKHQIKDLLSYMIRYSDNTAWYMLEDNVAKSSNIQSRINSLNLTNTSRKDYTTTAKDLGTLFEGIYRSTYLERSNSDYLINLLSTVIARHNDRIAAGVPAGTKVAHKIGNLGAVWQDAGIVYGPKSDFVIITLNKLVTYESGKKTISAIAKVTWDYFN